MNVNQITPPRIASLLLLGAVLTGCASSPDSPSPTLQRIPCADDEPTPLIAP